MQQQTFLNINVLYEVDSTHLFDGRDLKRIARGDDGRDYAAKRVQDGAFIPLSEWVGYHLWRACGLLVPECVILHYADGSAPAFGSRIENFAQQINKKPDAYTIAGFFTPHLATLQKCYPLDAFYVNPDRHGRNFLCRPGLTTDDLLCIDYSRAGPADSTPCGDSANMLTGNSHQWWSFFVKYMRARADPAALEAACALDDDWLAGVLDAAPIKWKEGLDVSIALDFWRNGRDVRAHFARHWSQLP